MSDKPLSPDKKGDYFTVDSRRLVFEEGLNLREQYGDLKLLAASIKAQGILTPLKCYKKGEEYVVLRGHRRTKALRILEKEGEVIMVPIMLEKKGYPVENRLLDQITENDGLAYTPWERAKVLKALENLGWGDEDMAERSGLGKGYVRRLLTLANAPQKLINLVREGRLAATEAMDHIAEGTVEQVLEAADKLHAAGTGAQLFGPDQPLRPTRITKSDIKPNSVKVFKKWSKQIKEEELEPAKAEIFKFIRRMIAGELQEKDIKKFFK